jgi:hypothetical protein
MLMLFKIFSILFIINNIYYLINYKRLDKPFKQRDKNSILDLFYYINKVIFWIWLIFGLFTPEYHLVLILISILLVRIPIFLINKRFSSILYRLTPPISIIILFFILF